MRKMISGIAAVLAMTALMAGSAMAGDKLIVKGVGGAAGNAFRVDDTGMTEARGAFSMSDATVNPVTGLPVKRTPILGVYNSDVLRMNVTPQGITEWQLNTGTVEGGFIKYTTPGGGVGFRLTHIGDTNPLDMAYYPNVGGSPLFALSGASTSIAVRRTGETGIGIAPTQKLHVLGGIRMETTALAQPACDANARGTFWFTAGTTDTLQICATTGTGMGWKTISLP